MPDWTAPLREALAGLQLSPSREAEVVEELSQHLDDRYAEHRAAGHDEAAARGLALAELHEGEAIDRRMRQLRQARVPPPIAAGTPRRRVLGDAWQDVRYAARMLRKQPGFTVAAVLTLALGIGANTAIFSLVNSALFTRLPVSEPERLIYVHRGVIGNVFSYPMFAAIRDGSRAFDGLAAWGGIQASLNADGATDLVAGFIVTGNFFDVLGVRTEQGRLIAPADDVTPGAHPVAVISHRLWQARFAAQPGIVGREIRLNGHVFTIVGVAPAGFPGPQVGATRDVYVPMMMQAVMRPPRAGYSGEMNPDLLKNPRNGWLFSVGRLTAGTTAEQARAELEAIATTFVRGLDPSASPTRIVTVPIVEGLFPEERQRMWSVALLLGGAVMSVLLIACANIANLLLSRTASRRRELAVRLAIGASRGRMIRQLLTESLLLSLLGGLAGIGLAVAMLRAFQAAPPPGGVLPFSIEASVDQRLLLFSLVLSLVTGIVFGLAPAIQASRPGLVPALKDGSAADEPRRRFNLKKTLVVAEVALSLLLLIAAGIFVRSLQAAHAIDPGVDVHRLLSAPLSVNLLRYTRAQGREFYAQVVERVAALPGVESASVARVPVLTGGGRVLSIHVEGRDSSNDRIMSEGASAVGGDPTRVNANVIGPGYFRTLGIPLLKGRDFEPQDLEQRPLVTIVSETTARMHFAGEEPIGRKVSFGGPQGPWREIVGVVRDSKYGTLGEGTVPIVYLPLAQNHETGMVLYVRAAVPPGSLVAGIRREIQAIEPNLPVPEIDTMAETVGTSLYAPRMGAWLLGIFGLLALLLAAVGIYGVLSFSIARRTREMGIRLALGARTRDVFLLVVRDGMVLVIAGIVIGLAAGLTGAQSLSSLVYGMSAWDPAAFTVVTCLLGAVALLACVVPARRAMRVDPITALRYD